MEAITSAEFYRLPPRMRARVSRTVQHRTGFEPEPYRPITNAMLRHLTDEETAQVRAHRFEYFSECYPRQRPGLFARMLSAMGLHLA